MWIFDSYYKGCVELWGRERGLAKVSAVYPPSFYMHLKDPPGDDRGTGDPLQSGGVAASGPSLVPSRVTGFMQAERWPKRSRSRPATRPNYIT
jgi:hypothetical protein